MSKKIVNIVVGILVLLVAVGVLTNYLLSKHEEQQLTEKLQEAVERSETHAQIGEPIDHTGVEDNSDESSFPTYYQNLEYLGTITRTVEEAKVYDSLDMLPFDLKAAPYIDVEAGGKFLVVKETIENKDAKFKKELLDSGAEKSLVLAYPIWNLDKESYVETLALQLTDDDSNAIDSLNEHASAWIEPGQKISLLHVFQVPTDMLDDHFVFDYTPDGLSPHSVYVDLGKMSQLG